MKKRFLHEHEPKHGSWRLHLAVEYEHCNYIEIWVEKCKSRASVDGDSHITQKLNRCPQVYSEYLKRTESPDSAGAVAKW